MHAIARISQLPHTRLWQGKSDRDRCTRPCAQVTHTTATARAQSTCAPNRAEQSRTEQSAHEDKSCLPRRKSRAEWLPPRNPRATDEGHGEHRRRGDRRTPPRPVLLALFGPLGLQPRADHPRRAPAGGGRAGFAATGLRRRPADPADHGDPCTRPHRAGAGRGQRTAWSRAAAVAAWLPWGSSSR